MSSVALPSARRIAWLRRRRALAGAWSQYRRSRPGMIGLVVLVVFVAVALAAPLLADEAGLSAVNTTANDPWATPGRVRARSAPTSSAAASGRNSSGARASACWSASPRPCSRRVIGMVVGIAAGFYGRRTGAVLMRLTEWFLVIPFLPLAIVLAAVLGPSIRNIILVIGITSWPSMARLVRAQVLTLKERLYVDRSRALGASQAHLMVRHILPSVSG